MNLDKEPKLGQGVSINVASNFKNIVLAGGCFWGTQKFVNRLPGIISSFTAYANGNMLDPTYDEVCTGNTDHAEAVYVVFDPEIIGLGHLLYYFLKSFNPTQKNYQGNDIGKQYRSGIYYFDKNDAAIAEKIISLAQKNHNKPIVTEVLPLDNLSKAEEDHQNYLDKNPFGYCYVILKHLPAEGDRLVGDIYE